MVIIMKFGKMKYDVPFEKLGSKTDRWDFNALENFMIKKEGKYLYKLYPSYVYLKDDPDLKKAIETLNNQSEYSKILSVMK